MKKTGSRGKMQGTPGSPLAWKTMRPIRPNPLMPILTAIAMSEVGQKFADALEVASTAAAGHTAV